MPSLVLNNALVLIPVVVLVIFLFAAVKIMREYERAVIFQLGRFWKVKGPGLILVIPILQQAVRVDMRIRVTDIPSQDIISRDNVLVKVNAVVYYRVMDARNAIIQVEDFMNATSQLAQTTLRSVLGQHELDEMLAERERLNTDLQRILDEQTESWGIKVANVELKHVDLDESMVRVIARQAEAERVRRAKIIEAEGEYQAAQKILEAATILAQRPEAMQLRYLGTLVDHRQRALLDDRLPVPHRPQPAARRPRRAGWRGSGERRALRRSCRGVRRADGWRWDLAAAGGAKPARRAGERGRRRNGRQRVTRRGKPAVIVVSEAHGTRSPRRSRSFGRVLADCPLEPDDLRARRPARVLAGRSCQSITRRIDGRNRMRAAAGRPSARSSYGFRRPGASRRRRSPSRRAPRLRHRLGVALELAVVAQGEAQDVRRALLAQLVHHTPLAQRGAVHPQRLLLDRKAEQAVGADVDVVAPGHRPAKSATRARANTSGSRNGASPSSRSISSERSARLVELVDPAEPEPCAILRRHLLDPRLSHRCSRSHLASRRLRFCRAHSIASRTWRRRAARGKDLQALDGDRDLEGGAITWKCGTP